MTYILIGILIIGGIAFLCANQKNLETKQKAEFKAEEKTDSLTEKIFFANDSLTLSEKLNKTKELYPFEKWREAFFEYEMEQYTEENCNAAKTIFDNLIDKLIALGENGNETEKIALFEIAVLSLNELENKNEGLIETGEREDLCELIDQITIACGLNPRNYADGEGLADLWREW